MGKLVDEVFKIVALEQAAKAEQDRRIDAVFPQPEPHVLQLTAEELQGKKGDRPILVASTPATP